MNLPLPEDALVAYFDEVNRTLTRASARTSEVQRTYMIGAFAVRVLSRNAELLDLMTRAFEHLPCADNREPDLTVHLHAGDPVPPSPFTWYAAQMGAAAASEFLHGDHPSHGELPTFTSARIKSAFHLYPSVLRLLDLQRCLAVEWIESVEALPSYTRSAPLHRILSWYLNRSSWIMVHGGAVGTGTGGVLFIGDSGMGKTTSTLSCLGTSLRYAGDDYCLVGLDPAHVYSLYHTAKLKTESDVQRFPHFRRLVDNPQRPAQDKALLFLNDFEPSPVIAGFPLRALIIPRRTDSGDTRLLPASAAQALNAIAPSTLAEQPGSRAALFSGLARLVASVPAYLLEVNADIARIAAQVERLLAGEVRP